MTKPGPRSAMDHKKSEVSTAEVITKRRRALYNKKGYINLLIRIILLLAASYILLTQVFLITRAKGNDMFPAIKDGDLVVAFRLQKDYVKNDVVVYKVNEVAYLGRVVARETDVVTLDDSGKLLVNGTEQRGEIVYPTVAKAGINYPLRIEEQRLFVLGDHRMESTDSRDYGPLDLKQVKGKVITILRRRGL